ncbi:MAG: cell division protein FtsA [Treponema sp.]|nr:cell division protein FtsA [Treponema sp.]
MVVGLDIGSTKVCAAIGERSETGTIEITGVGLCPSGGMRKGVVVNIEATLRAVREAVEAAQMMSGRDVNSCWTGIGGSHIDGINSRGVVAVTGKDRELREIGGGDIARVLEAARAVVIPMDRQVLEVIPQSYIVDDHKGIKDPLDMIGVRLEAEVHIITCSVTSAQNLIKCVNRAGYYVNDLILQPLAAGRAALTGEERDLGTALVDIGGGTTEMLVYCDGAPYSIVTIPAGGSQVTGDISIIKNISFETAERIKIESGSCLEGMDESDDDIIVPGVGGRAPIPIPRSQILAIIQPRMEEIFKMVKEKLDKIALSRPLGAGIVLTGGGAQLLGATELASRIFKMPVRVGSPIPGGVLSGGLVEAYRSPVYSTAIGLVMEGFDRQAKEGPERNGEGRVREKGPPNIVQAIRDWLGKEFF